MRLLIGYLATPGGADALALAVRLARTFDAELDICAVLPVPVPLNMEYQGELGEQAEQWLDVALKSVPEGVTAHTHVSFHESFAEGISAEAERLGAAAIVVGGAGGGLVGGFSLGSVVNELLHSAPVPVVVAPRGIRHSDVERVRSVTCAVGMRPGAEHLLDLAVRVSTAAGGPLRLVSLVPLDEFGSQQGALDHAAETLATAKSELPEGFPVSVLVADGATVEAAVEKLDWRDGDLIMVGSSRLAQPRRLFLGSTAAKMLRVLHVPLVVVPRQEG
ncbi:universal stress protein [Mycolicibacterium sarraceniae]|uniref:Universal stress protein UspA n=1 Tax=Mycolicibacterium sarraceniae TaxID=1534348 RepID=A0A7I7SQM1_9MYCO|nr:universal stress protein [Mycolicibacterium sarraceniae]BBY58345.1 universal stress protein UspA [Mycolicibacterium sarraceniae]